MDVVCVAEVLTVGANVRVGLGDVERDSDSEELREPVDGDGDGVVVGDLVKVRVLEWVREAVRLKVLVKLDVMEWDKDTVLDGTVGLRDSAILRDREAERVDALTVWRVGDLVSVVVAELCVAVFVREAVIE